MKTCELCMYDKQSFLNHYCLAMLVNVMRMHM